MRILLDTNAWLDNYLPGRANHAMVGDLLYRALRTGHDVLFAAVSAKDIFYIISRTFKVEARGEGGLTDSSAGAINEIAWACVANMSEIATPVGMDGSDLWIASKYKRLHADFEDDLVIAAALRAQVDYLVTSDEQLLRRSPVAALCPQDMLRLLEV